MGPKARGYLLAAVSVTACAVTCTAVVHADDGIARAIGRHREYAHAQLCERALTLSEPSLTAADHPPKWRGWAWGACHGAFGSLGESK